MAKRGVPKRPSDEAEVTRDDLERGLRALQFDVKEKVADKRSALITAAGVGVVLVALVIFLLGRRSGRKKNTIVEIRRV